MANWPVYGEITGPIVMIGFGSIGKGTLPLIERHFKYDKSRFVVIDPEDKDRHLCDERGIRFIKQASIAASASLKSTIACVSPANLRTPLTPWRTAHQSQCLGRQL